MTDYNQQFNHLIKDMTHNLCKLYLIEVEKRLPVNDGIDTSPLLNLTLSVFSGSLINILDFIKSHTIGEVELIENIDLAKDTLLNAIKSLPFIKKIEFF